MKSIENSTVLNTWALLFDFEPGLAWISSVNTGLSSRLHPRTFMVSWRFCDRDGQWKRRIQREVLNELPKLPCHTAESKIFRTATNLVSKRAKCNVDFENNWLFRKTSMRDEKLHFHLIVLEIIEKVMRAYRTAISNDTSKRAIFLRHNIY